jgi:hypothetical protein
MTFDEWHDHYKPIKNWLRKDDDVEMFETYDVEVGVVLGVNRFDQRKVWTLVDGDEGMWIINGFHYVNRFGYFITEVPYEGAEEYFEVLYDTYDEPYDDTEELAWVEKTAALASAKTEEEVERIIAK